MGGFIRGQAAGIFQKDNQDLAASNYRSRILGWTVLTGAWHVNLEKNEACLGVAQRLLDCPVDRPPFPRLCIRGESRYRYRAKR